jgi:hypothetical protein
MKDSDQDEESHSQGSGLGEFESGRRESNPRSQLGKTFQSDRPDVSALEGQLSEQADEIEPPPTDSDAP